MTLKLLLASARPTLIARVAGGFVVMIGLVVLTGWMLDVPFLKGPLPGLVQMKADTAVGFLAAGVALLLAIGGSSASRRRAVRLLAGVVILLGALTLAEYVLGTNLGIDELLFRDPLAVHTVHPGRLAPQTALTFAGLGFALMAVNTSRRRLVATLTGTCFLIALFAVIGYAYGVAGLSDVPSLTPIALHTAVTLLVLCAGIAAADPHGVLADGLTNEGPGTVVAKRLLPVSVLLLPTLGWACLQGEQAGLYSTATGVALFVLTSVIGFGLAILLLARRLNRLDAERRNAAASVAYLAALVDASRDAIISTDIDGIITTWNHGATELFGYSETEIVGQPVTVLRPPERSGEQRDWLRGAARGEVKIAAVTQRLHKSGALLDVSLTLSRIVQDGSFAGFCATSHDVGGQVRAHDQLEQRVRERTDDLFHSRAETLKTLALAAEYRDDDTAQHTERVGEHAARLAARLGLEASLVTLIGQAAPLHDVGKIGIPDHILLKPGRLSAEEFEVMKRHTTLGANLLTGSQAAIFKLGEQIALTHHERWDGSGYPRGLAGEAIPIAGRIVAVVDSFDAMTHQRPYKSACTIDEALTEISGCSGSQFDPRVVHALLALHHQPHTNGHVPQTNGRGPEPTPRGPRITAALGASGVTP